MLDIQFIRENKDQVKEAAKNKNVDLDIDALLKLGEELRPLQQQIDELRSSRNQLASAGKKPSDADIKKGQELRDKLNKLDQDYSKKKSDFTSLMYAVPNMYSDDTPVGKDESANKVLRQVGEKPKLEKPNAHWQLGEEKGFIDLERAAKVSGSRSAYLKGGLVRLQFALIQFALDVLTSSETLKKIAKEANLDVSDKPFVPVLTPALIREDVFKKTGRYDPIEDKYVLKEDGQVLAGSAEHALAPMHMDEVLGEEDLPLRYLGYSTNFRREAGSYGKDVKGIIRLHQFDKLEAESITTPEDGLNEQNFLLAIQEYLMQQLELPYQVVAISSGDMGKPDWRQIDIETWMAGEGKYRETQTADYVTDFQARRLNIKYKTKDGKKAYVHMNDATIFSQRPLIAILENNQTKDGKVKIPEVLKDYMKGEYL